MHAPKYRIESSAALRSDLLEAINYDHLYENSSLAVAIAAKTVTEPTHNEIRVVQVPGGEVIFRSTTFG